MSNIKNEEMLISNLCMPVMTNIGLRGNHSRVKLIVLTISGNNSELHMTEILRGKVWQDKIVQSTTSTLRQLGALGDFFNKD